MIGPKYLLALDQSIMTSFAQVFQDLNPKDCDPVTISLSDHVPGAFIIKNALSDVECKHLEAAVLEVHEAIRSEIQERTIRRQSQVHIPIPVPQDTLYPLCERLRSHLPQQISPTSPGQLAPPGEEISSFFRAYSYSQGDFSAPHFDKSYRKHVDGKLDQLSCYSIVFYLNDVNNRGGCTTFFEPDPLIQVSSSGKTPLLNDSTILKICLQVNPQCGDALCFPHGNYHGSYPSPLHEGSPVLFGTKSILRSDIVFSPVSKIRKLKIPKTRVIAVSEDLKSVLEKLIQQAIEEIDPTKVITAEDSISFTNDANGVEIECNAAEKMFWMIYRSQPRASNATIRIVSPYGLEQEYTRRSLAETLISYLPSNHPLAYVSLSKSNNAKSGIIYMTSRSYAEARLNQGQLMCELCGKFVQQTKSGLEWHLKTVHHIESHESAHCAVVRSSSALIKYSASLPLSHAVQPTKTVLNPKDIREAMQNPEVLQELIAGRKIKQISRPLEACRSGDLAALKKCVAEGWNPNATTSLDSNGCSGLLWAAGFGHLEICKYLVDVCSVSVAKQLQQGRRGYSERNALHWAARNGHLPVVKWLVEEKDLFVDLGSSDGTTALCLAAWQCQKHICEYLVEKADSNPHLVNSYGCNIAMWCAQSSHEDTASVLSLCEFFHRHQVDFTLLNSNGQGCLHKAAQRGNHLLCQWLIETIQLPIQHFLPNAAEKSTPSQLAFFAGYPQLAQYLTTFEST